VIDVEIGRLLAYRVATLQDTGKVPNYEASVSKLYGSELVQRVARFAVSYLGMSGQLLPGSAHALAGGRLTNAYMTSVSATIAGGTSEVQRGIIAGRGLGMPR